jgi:hypothetical protein
LNPHAAILIIKVVKGCTILDSKTNYRYKNVFIVDRRGSQSQGGRDYRL